MSAAYHEAAITEARQAWRVAFWDRVAAHRQRRQERLAGMFLESRGDVKSWEVRTWRNVRDVLFSPSDILTDTNRPFLPTDHAGLFRRLAAGHEEACEKLLDVDFRP